MLETLPNRLVRLSVAVAGGVLLTWAPAQAQDDQPEFNNLQVLPKDISRRALNRVMLGNLRGLGLPRRQNSGCLFCHVGDMDVPSDTWDWASDDKPTKRKARAMLAMVQSINDEHLAGLEERVAPSLRVTCYTCHSGRTDPRPLTDILLDEYDTGGIDSMLATYQRLRERYYGGDAYDFRIDVLPGLAYRLLAGGAFDDALALAATNTEVYPGATARRVEVTIILLRAIEERGVEAGLAEFDRFKSEEDAGVVSLGVLDGLGWGMFRRGDRTDALALFRKNRAEFPEQYVPMESLADALMQTGDREAGVRLFEEFVERNPDHANARRRLMNLREGSRARRLHDFGKVDGHPPPVSRGVSVVSPAGCSIGRG